ncbi:MAG: hypothetical protein OEV94_12075 [Deltaproteobacteria bacterium]|nr:hypothetical protein [Deltaproteobacteria bacterium]
MSTENTTGAGNPAEQTEPNALLTPEANDAAAAEQTMDAFVAQRRAQKRGELKAQDTANAPSQSETEDPASGKGGGENPASKDKLSEFVDKEDEKKYGSAVARRIATVTQTRHHWQNQANALAKENQRLLDRLNEVETRSTKTDPAEPTQRQAQAATPGSDTKDPRPQPENYADIEKFREDENRWVARDEARKIEAQRQEARHAAAQRQAQQEFTATLDVVNAKAGELFPEEWGGHLGEGDISIRLRGQLTNEMQLGIASIGRDDPALAAMIAHYWASNPAELQKLRSLDPYRMVLEIGKTVARFAQDSQDTRGTAAAKQPNTSSVANAGAAATPAKPLPAAARAVPRALTPVRGTGAVADPETMTMDQWVEHRRAEHRRQRGY